MTLIDAPMSGAPIAASRGELTFMVGGPACTIEGLMPLLEAMGSRIFHAGSLGAGMTIKVLNNYVAASSVVAVRRAMELAGGLGVPAAELRNVMSASSGATWYGNHFDEISWSKEGYDPGNTIGILEKDVLSALDGVKGIESLPESTLDDAVLRSLRALEPVIGRFD